MVRSYLQSMPTKSCFPEKKSRNKWQQNIFLLTVTKSPSSVSSAFSHDDTCNSWLSFSHVCSDCLWLYTFHLAIRAYLSSPFFPHFWLGLIYFSSPSHRARTLSWRKDFVLRQLVTPCYKQLNITCYILFASSEAIVHPSVMWKLCTARSRSSWSNGCVRRLWTVSAVS